MTTLDPSLITSGAGFVNLTSSFFFFFRPSPSSNAVKIYSYYRVTIGREIKGACVAKDFIYYFFSSHFPSRERNIDRERNQSQVSNAKVAFASLYLFRSLLLELASPLPFPFRGKIFLFF